MVMRPSEIHAELSELMAGFDAGVYAVADCERLVGLFADVERMAGYAKGLCMVRVADAGGHRGRGGRSPSAGLGDAAGMDPAAAARAVRNARRAARGSASDAAARKGKVSPDAAADAADAADGDPEVEARLIDTTVREGRRAGRDAAAAVRRAASEAADRARAHRIGDRRGVRHWVDRDGLAHLGWAGNPIDLAQVLAALHPWALATGEPNASKAKADGLVAMARAAVAPGMRNGRTEPAVRVDGAALARGYAEPDETCDVVGVGAVPVTLIRDALRNGASLVTITHTDGSVVTYADHGSLGPGPFAGVVVLTGVAHDPEPVDLGPYDPVALIDHGVLVQLASWAGRDITADTHTRTATTPQRRALTWLHPTCAHRGCDTVHGLEADHTTPWHQTHTTELANLTLRCPHHHRHKTRHDPTPTRPPRTRRPQPPATPHHDTLPLVC